MEKGKEKGPSKKEKGNDKSLWKKNPAKGKRKKERIKVYGKNNPA